MVKSWDGGLICHVIALIMRTTLGKKTYCWTHFPVQHVLPLWRIHCLSSTSHYVIPESQGSTTLYAQRTCLTLWMIKRVTNKCLVCLEFKPQYHKPNRVPVIKATQPFERINIDFKGPLPSNNGNVFSYHRWQVLKISFRIPMLWCINYSSHQVLDHTILSLLTGMPAYVHLDQGPLSWAMNSYIPYIIIFSFHDDLTLCWCSPIRAGHNINDQGSNVQLHLALLPGS